MSRRKLYPLLILPFLFILLTNNSCRKEKHNEITRTVPPNNSAEVQFFPAVSDGLDRSVQKIISKIKKDNGQNQFLENFIRVEGFAIWDKAVRIQSDSTASHQSTDQRVIDEQVLIPLVQKDSQYVKAALICTVKDDSVYIHLLDGRTYKKNSEDQSGNINRQISLTLMMLDKKVFGHESFDITDPTAFGGLGKTVSSVRLSGNKSGEDGNHANGSSRMVTYTLEICYTMTVPANNGQLVGFTPAGGNQYVEEYHCDSYTGWYNDSGTGAGGGGGSAGGSGLGSGGGGSAYTNPPVPCTPSGSVAKVTPGNLVPCASNGTGWVPADVTYLTIVTFLTKELNLNAEQKKVLDNKFVTTTINQAILENGLSEETKAASLVLIEAARNSFIQGPYNIDHFNKIKTQIPNSSQYSSVMISPIYWIHFIAQVAMIRAEHPEWNSWRVYWEATSEIIHTGLDVIGLIPVVGEIADITNGILYTIQGDGLNASLSFVAALPGVGWSATAAKYAKKTITLANGTKATLKWYKKTDGIISFGKQNSSQFRKLLGLSTSDARQAHHIIPWEIAEKSNVVIQKAAQARFPFHVQDILNGIPLSAVQHNGSHALYTDRVVAALTDIEKRNGTGLTPEIAFKEIVDLTNKIKAAIIAKPNTSINNIIF